jgi:hypothetical protein
MTHIWSLIASAAALLIVVAAIADRRRTARTNLDAVGIVPWPLISLLATFVALFAFAIAIKVGF